MLHTGDFVALDTANAWLSVSGPERVMAWVNGWCLGRLRAEGPQRALYVPAPLIRPGRNVVAVLDLAPADDEPTVPRAHFVESMLGVHGDWAPTEPGAAPADAS